MICAAYYLGYGSHQWHSWKGTSFRSTHHSSECNRNCASVALEGDLRPQNLSKALKRHFQVFLETQKWWTQSDVLRPPEGPGFYTQSSPGIRTPSGHDQNTAPVASGGIGVSEWCRTLAAIAGMTLQPTKECYQGSCDPCEPHKMK